MIDTDMRVHCCGLNSSTRPTLYQSQTVNPSPQPTWSRYIAAFLPVEINEEELDQTANAPCVCFEDDVYNKTRKTRENLPARARKKWRKAAIWATVVSIVLSLAFSLASFFVSANFGSDSALALAFDCSLALFNSTVVLWRFRVQNNLGPQRERICCQAFGVSFVLAGLVTCGTSIVHITTRDGPKIALSITLVFMFSCIAYLVLAVVQYRISEKLQSSAMLASSVDSGLSGILIFGLLLANLIYDSAESDLWYLDHAVAIFAGAVTVLCGLKILVDVLIYKKLPIEAME